MGPTRMRPWRGAAEMSMLAWAWLSRERAGALRTPLTVAGPAPG